MGDSAICRRGLTPSAHADPHWSEPCNRPLREDRSNAAQRSHRLFSRVGSLPFAAGVVAACADPPSAMGSPLEGTEGGRGEREHDQHGNREQYGVRSGDTPSSNRHLEPPELLHDGGGPLRADRGSPPRHGGQRSRDVLRGRVCPGLAHRIGRCSPGRVQVAQRRGGRLLERLRSAGRAIRIAPPARHLPVNRALRPLHLAVERSDHRRVRDRQEHGRGQRNVRCERRCRRRWKRSLRPRRTPVPPCARTSVPPCSTRQRSPPAIRNGGAHCLSAALVPASEASQLAILSHGALCARFVHRIGGRVHPGDMHVDRRRRRALSRRDDPRSRRRAERAPPGDVRVLRALRPLPRPTTGKLTGACNLSCDPGPKDPPVKLQACCSENGTDRESACRPRSSRRASKPT